MVANYSSLTEQYFANPYCDETDPWLDAGLHLNVNHLANQWLTVSVVNYLNCYHN